MRRVFSFRPLTSRLSSRVLRKSLLQASDRTVEIAPSKEWIVAPPIMLRGEADRIIGHHDVSNPAINLARLKQRLIVQGPTRMHLVRDAYIGDGQILTPTAFDRFGKGSKSPLLFGDADHIEEAVFCSTHMTELYFGHWLKDGVCHELLAEDQGIIPLVADVASYAHREPYRRLLSLAPERSRLTCCDKLWILEDHENNAHFVARYERLRQRIGQQWPSKKIFLARGDRVGRRLLNEAELQSALPDFEFIYPEQITALQLTAALSQARIVIAPEGSAISHATIAMPRGSTLLTIIGAQHFNMPYKVLCDALGIRFALTIADAEGNDFRQPLSRLLQTLDLCS